MEGPVSDCNECHSQALGSICSNDSEILALTLLRELLKSTPAAARCVNHLQDGFAPIHHACGANNAEILKELIDLGADLNCKTDDSLYNAEELNGRSPLYISAADGSTDCCECLLANGVDLDIRSTKMEATPLHIATQKRRVEIIETLLRAGMKVNSILNDGTTSLMIAAQYNYSDVLRILLQFGADVHMRRSRPVKVTALYIACAYGSIGAVEMLMSDSSPAFNQSPETSPISISCQNGRLEILQLLCKEVEPRTLGKLLTRELLGHPASSAMHLACINNHVDLVSWIVRWTQARPSTSLISMPTFIACFTGRLFKMCQLITVATGCSYLHVEVNANHPFREWLDVVKHYSPLQIACDARLTNVCEWLILGGADPTARGRIDMTPYEITQRTNTYHNAAPVCADTTRLLRVATLPWSPKTDKYFPKSFRDHIQQLLQIGRELAKQDSTLPPIPYEIWCHVLSFLQRGDENSFLFD